MVQHIFNTPFEVHTMSGGRESQTECELSCATPALFNEQAAVKTYFWKAIGKMNAESSFDDEQIEKAKQKLEKEKEENPEKNMDAESAMTIMYSNLNPKDIENCFSSFKNMLAKGCLTMEDVKVDINVVNKIYPDDLEILLGLYIANFTKFGNTSQK